MERKPEFVECESILWEAEAKGVSYTPAKPITDKRNEQMLLDLLEREKKAA